MALCNFCPFNVVAFYLHKFRIVYANVLKFHIWIPHGKIGDPYFSFLSELSPILELFPIDKITLK